MPYKNPTQDETLPQGFNHNFRERFWKNVFKSQSCWIWNGTLDKNGYGTINKGNNRCVFAHRASWIIANGEIKDALHVLHKCDNPKCVNPDHLFLGTQQDNVADCLKKGRTCRGEKSARATLTWEIVRIIRRQFEEGLRKVDIARIHNLAEEHVRKIIENQRWIE